MAYTDFTLEAALEGAAVTLDRVRYFIDQVGSILAVLRAILVRDTALTSNSV